MQTRVSWKLEPVYGTRTRTRVYVNVALSGVSSQCSQRKERNEMTSLMERPITAASDDGVCCRHAAKLWQTRAKLLKLNLICIISCTISEKILKFGPLIFFKFKL